MRSPLSLAGTRWLLLGVLLALSASACFGPKKLFECPDGSRPCGNGCIPAQDTVCCIDHFEGATSSSYCTNSAGGGCSTNGSRGCQAAFPSGTAAQFCCSGNSSLGSNDCPAGQKHCGLECVPEGADCCAGKPCGKTAAMECSEGGVSCGWCESLGSCRYCDPGFCCYGDYCGGTGKCIQNSVCPGTPLDTGGGGGGGSCAGGGFQGSTRACVPLGPGGSCVCSGSTDVCITPADFQGTGAPFPGSCSAEGTSGCLNNTGTLVHPCCPGLTCKVSSKCGGSATGGNCLP